MFFVYYINEIRENVKKYTLNSTSEVYFKSYTAISNFSPAVRRSHLNRVSLTLKNAAKQY